MIICEEGEHFQVTKILNGNYAINVSPLSPFDLILGEEYKVVGWDSSVFVSFLYRYIIVIKQ